MTRTTRDLVKRSARSLFALVGLFITVFLALEWVPVDPARATLGVLASEESVARLKEDLGLGRPLAVRLPVALFHALRGEFGVSFQYRREAGPLVLEGAEETFGRAALAITLAAPLGLLGALRAAPRPRSSLGVAAVFLHTAPAFCVAVALVAIASRTLGLSPVSDRWAFDLLAVLVATLPPFGLVFRFVFDQVSRRGRRPPFVELLDFLKAPAAGRRRVLLRAQVIQAVAVSLDAMSPCLTAVSVAEIVFNLPGLGLLFYRSCERSDRPIVLAATILFGAVFLASSELADWHRSRWAPERLTEA